MVVREKLPIGWMKLNVDGSCRDNPGSFGGGEIRIDAPGIFKAMFLKNFAIVTGGDISNPKVN